MFVSDPQSEILAANQRLAQAQREVASLRLARARPNDRRVGAALDAALVRLTEGARSRQAERAAKRSGCPGGTLRLDT